MLKPPFFRERALLGIAGSGALIAVCLIALSVGRSGPDAGGGASELLTERPWHCEVSDPERLDLVSRSVETFHPEGVVEGRTRLEDRGAGRVLLEFSYRGVWQFDDPWLTESIREYQYLHVDEDEFSAADLAAIEAEFAEPEVSRVHALTAGQLVYGANRSLYQCHRRALEPAPGSAPASA